MPVTDLNVKQDRRLSVIKRELIVRGTTLAQWARRHGFAWSTVRRAVVGYHAGPLSIKIARQFKADFKDL